MGKRTQRQPRHRRQKLEAVFRLILEYVASVEVVRDPWTQQKQHKSPVDRLHQLLPLTGVCRKWRKATLPLFYEAAVCSIQACPRMQCTAPRGIGAKRQRVMPSYTATTNLGLVVEGRHEGHVKRLVIDLVGDVSPDAVVAVLSDAGLNQIGWLGIEKLRIAHWHGSTLHKPPVYTSESLARLNSYLLHSLPSLTSIKYSSPDDRRYYREFPLDGLLASTLSRLKEVKLVSGLIPDMGSTAFFPMLTSLTLHCPILAGAAHLPMVFAEMLESLAIGFSSADSIWDRFYSAAGSTKRSRITFKRLRTLELEYMVPGDAARAKGSSAARLRTTGLYDDCYQASSESSSIYGEDSDTAASSDPETLFLGNDSDDASDEATLLDPDSPTAQLFKQQAHSEEASSRPRPSFPRLQSLSIKKYPGAVTSVLRHFAIDQIAHISIRDVSRGWASLHPSTAAAHLATLRMHLSADSLGSKRAEQRYQAWINQLFSTASAMRSLQLDAPTSLPVSLPDIVGLTNLVSLSFSMRVDLGAIPNLLSRLPTLLQLAMHVHPSWSSWSLRNFGLLAPGHYEMLLHMPPLSLSLKSLVAYVGLDSPAGDSGTETIGDESTDDRPMVVEQELAWLLARIPSLVAFKSEEWTSRAVRRCIADLVSHDPVASRVQHLHALEMAVWRY